MKRLLCTVIAALALAGCATKEVIVEVEKIKYVFVEPPRELQQRVPAGAPPSVEDVAKATCEQRNEMLSMSLHANYERIGACNAQVDSFREWVVKNKAIYAK